MRRAGGAVSCESGVAIGLSVPPGRVPSRRRAAGSASVAVEHGKAAREPLREWAPDPERGRPARAFHVCARAAAASPSQRITVPRRWGHPAAAARRRRRMIGSLCDQERSRSGIRIRARVMRRGALLRSRGSGGTQAALRIAGAAVRAVRRIRCARRWRRTTGWSQTMSPRAWWPKHVAGRARGVTPFE